MKEHGKLMTGPEGWPSVSDFQRRKIAIYEDGTVLAVEGAIHDEEIKSLLSLAQRMGVRCKEPAIRQEKFLIELYAKAGIFLRDAKNGGSGSTSESDLSVDLMSWIARAREAGASDLHCSYGPDRVQGKFRINGEAEPIDMKMSVEMMSKFMRGSYSYSTQKGGQYDEFGFNEMAIHEGLPDYCDVVRGQYSPTGYKARRVVFRFHWHDAPTTYADMGWDDYHIEMLEDVEDTPDGFMAFTGPTNSGKTTALRVMMGNIRRKYPGETVDSVEDPEELRVEGMNALPVFVGDGQKTAEAAAFGYERAIGAMLRSDLNRGAIGEVRYASTAKALFDVVLSGHPMYGSLHVKNWQLVLPRFKQLGVDPDLLTNPEIIRMLGGMRLVGELCPCCREEVRAEEFYGRLGESLKKMDGQWYQKGIGCDYVSDDGKKRCRGGYIGVTTVAELVSPSSRQLALFMEGKHEAGRYDWLSSGGRSKLWHAEKKMRQGILDPRDVRRFIGMPGADQAFMESFARENQLHAVA